MGMQESGVREHKERVPEKENRICGQQKGMSIGYESSITKFDKKISEPQ